MNSDIRMNACTASGRADNRFFSFYGFQLYREDKCALDVRMYLRILFYCGQLQERAQHGKVVVKQRLIDFQDCFTPFQSKEDQGIPFISGI